MSIPKNIVEDTEFAKNHLMQSSLDEKCKKQLLSLLHTASEATNGITLEEKVQKITESILGLVISQITFLDSVDKKIATANQEKCNGCKAMKLANDTEEQKRQEEIINAWKEANGIKDAPQQANVDVKQLSMSDTVKMILLKPFVWIFGTVVAFSPYGVDMLNAILKFLSKG